jgi:uncharacterized membrane protein (UPF0127 family)
MRTLTSTLLVVLLSTHQAGAQSEPPSAASGSQSEALRALQIKSFLVKAEVADRPSSRARGLMHRQSLADNHGMLFVFDSPSRQCMWMKNTPLALSVAFIDTAGQIVNIEQMQPQTETIHCSTSPVVYALEMQQGWFWARAIRAGDEVRGLPPLPTTPSRP